MSRAIKTSKELNLFPRLETWLKLAFIIIAVSAILEETLGFGNIVLGIVISCLLLGFLTTLYIYDHAKAYGRNAVAWTAAVAFFNYLGVILYLLTWPKDAKLQILEPQKAKDDMQKQIQKLRQFQGHFCPECGKELKRKGKFCSECGADLIGYEDSELVCDECGSTIDKNDKFCISCGVEFAKETGDQDNL